ncbi:hypothetical protein AKO1_008646 [Acrasis kona]|uniref:Ubiquitin-like domain-containing protein n=1 Tax=Acrasis kona TaxID=1008807 RepID=A0AAW2ZCJ7_9EUKA
MPKVKLFTDRNLIKIISQGWDLDRLVQGKIGTLSGKTFEITLPEDIGYNVTIKDLKALIEDQEGIPIEKQEIRKGSKQLDQDKPLKHFIINEGDTLLLIIASDDFDKYFFQPLVDESNGMKVKTKPQVTQTLTIDNETAGKLPEGDWWKSTSMLSGPQNPRRSITSASNNNITSTSSTTFNSVATNDVQTPSPEERRRQLRAATEQRIKLLSKK